MPTLEGGICAPHRQCPPAFSFQTGLLLSQGFLVPVVTKDPVGSSALQSAAHPLPVARLFGKQKQSFNESLPSLSHLAGGGDERPQCSEPGPAGRQESPATSLCLLSWPQSPQEVPQPSVCGGRGRSEPGLGSRLGRSQLRASLARPRPRWRGPSSLIKLRPEGTGPRGPEGQGGSGQGGRERGLPVEQAWGCDVSSRGHRPWWSEVPGSSSWLL